MRRYFFSIGFIFLLGFWGLSLQASLTQKTADGEILIPVNAPLYVVVKGMFDTKQEAEKTRAFIQQLLVKTQADGMIESSKLAGFPPNKWLLASAFDSESKAKWWMLFGDRNPKLPRPRIKKTQLLEASAQIPYFPDPVRDGEQRFFTEEEVVARIHQFPDVKALKQKGSIKLVFLSFPRTHKYFYEVEVMKPEGSKFVAYDFISVFAGNLNKYSRMMENMAKK